MAVGGKRINPLSRRPKKTRLVVAVRGAAGVGKSVFASTLADAGLGRLCFFDVERKARLLPGSDGSKFDALEIEHPDELPEFIDWALSGEGREQNYGCFALDSWAMYFGRKHRETLRSVRERTGDPTALPSAEELAADQMLFQEVLRRLCIDSGSCVVICDQIAAKGKEDREENELGRVLPMTSGGLEYFVDVMAELSVRLEGFKQVRVMRVIKTNSPAFPVGTEFLNPTFSDLLARLKEFQEGQSGANGTAEAAPVEEAPPFLEEKKEEPKPQGPSLQDLLDKAAEYGLGPADVLVASKYYFGEDNLQRLQPHQIKNLFDRLVARMEANGSNAAKNGSRNGANGAASNGVTHTEDSASNRSSARRRA